MKLASYALVLIDLQQRIVARPTQPRPATLVVARAARLANAFRQRSRLVVVVRTVNLDAPDAEGDQIVTDVISAAGELIVTKHTLGAFHCTPLDLYLRRSGATGIVLAGLMTNFGVESTARAADEYGYQIVFAEDAMASLSAEAHAFAVSAIFPVLGVVSSTEAIIATLADEATDGGHTRAGR